MVPNSLWLPGAWLPKRTGYAWAGLIAESSWATRLAVPKLKLVDVMSGGMKASTLNEGRVHSKGKVSQNENPVRSVEK